MAKERSALRDVRRAQRCGGLALTVLLLLSGMPGVSQAAKVPANFQSYARTDVGGGLSCVVGATTTNRGGSQEHAYVYLEDSASHQVRWITQVPVHPGWYQNRASHCVATDENVYALVQSDTNAVPVLSQTLISVATLSKESGRLRANEIVKVPDRTGAHTVLVYEGAGNFRIDDGKIVVKGEWATKGDATETRTPFEIRLAVLPAT